ncbi:MAG: aminopeptidase N [Planctomycetota bacterium]|jgi:aminopeptidase N
MLAAGLTLLALTMPQDPTPGIDRDLARARQEQIRDVQYDLRFRLTSGAEHVEGSIWIRFVLDSEEAPAPIVLDFAGEEINSIQINSKDVQLERIHNHLVVPADLLGRGRNGIRANFRAKVAPTGTPLTVYRDATDKREYFYTLLVPADAHGLFPCFDQPDLRAKFRLELDVPKNWTAVSNAAPIDASDPTPVGEVAGKLWRFAQTKPLPTYLFAFATGPFIEFTPPHPNVPGVTSDEPMRILLRDSKLKDLDRAAITKLHYEGLTWLARTFDVPYPFGKLDLVLLPGFPYGGMEHAGAIFYRESALIFDHPPTVDEQVRRSTLIYHELSHQWFGNLVSMKWFDDLWLKEGFATFYGYKAMAELEPGQRAWLRFLQRVKPSAYAVDATAGTTPVFQELQNLADAKSAYGAIVYNKAPAVLRALYSQLGPEVFQAGLKQFLEKHAYGNADWRDLAAALEGAARKDLGRWSQRWLLAPSMPQVRCSWQAGADGLVQKAVVTQRALGGEGSWPMDLELLIFDADGSRRTGMIQTDAPETSIAMLLGKPAPVAILVNPHDVAYGQFVPDAISTEWLLANAPELTDPLERACATAALYEAVREAELDPLKFANMAITMIAGEDDPNTHSWLLGRLGNCLHRYLTDERAQPLRDRTTDLLLKQLADEGNSGREIGTYRFLAKTSTADGVLELCRKVINSKSAEDLPAGLSAGKQDRFLAAGALIAAGQVGTKPEEHPLQRLKQRYAGTDSDKEQFLAAAATPTAATKQAYWQRFLVKDDPPEQWTQDSLSWFHWSGQEELTLPYLELALKQVDWVKANRRIFFMPAWLNAFINGHSSKEALAIVDKFLAESELSDDIKNKMLQSRDGLWRAVQIREAFAKQPK